VIKPRRDIPAGQVPELLDRINKELDRLGVETQPKVAMKLIELSGRADAQVLDYYEVVRTDAALTGRILRLANCAMFALRQPCTRLDRALIILGLERAKAISLGFYLSRAASGGPGPTKPAIRDLSRRVWGQSVYRACLATCMARARCPAQAPEAFVIGLMLDAGQALIPRVLGERYERFWGEHPQPQRLFEAEWHTLPFTHVDVAAALCRRWRLPALLARPIAGHHALPPDDAVPDAGTVLHRIACYAGSVSLDPATDQPTQRAPMLATAERVLKVTPGDLEKIVKAAGEEYGAAMACFADVAETLPDLEARSDAVRAQLVEALDEQMQRAIKAETRTTSEKLRVGGHEVELEHARDPGEIVAYINGADGERLVSCTVNPSRETTDAIGHMLGLDDAPEDEVVELVRVMRLMAA
jgi:HD-like signal output (HDOD) protein